MSCRPLFLRCSLLFVCAGFGIEMSPAWAADASPAFTDAAAAGPDFATQGEYAGELSVDGKSGKYGVQVIALGNGEFEAVCYEGGLPGAGWDQSKPPKKHKFHAEKGAAEFKTDLGQCRLADGAIEISDAKQKKLGKLAHVERKSATLGEQPPAGAVVLFDGKSADQFNGGKLSSDNLLRAGAVSKEKFQNFQLHLEFRTPFMPMAREQARGNSGVYLQNRYEVQVLDSFGLEGKDNECGGIYHARPPKVNMCLPPLSWQTYDIDFKAAQFDDQGKKTKDAVVTVWHNGVPIHENLSLPTFTPGGEGKEAATPGPLQLQNHGNPVAFRNIWIVPQGK